MRSAIDKKTWIPAATACVLWFLMFSPLTKDCFNFWLMMGTSAAMLLALTLSFDGKKMLKALACRNIATQVFLGIAIAAALWGIFWLGDKISQLMFSFARSQVDDVYGMKSDISPRTVGMLLLFLVGPAEELLWRGFIKRRLFDCYSESKANPGLWAMAVTTAAYTLIHIWSCNFMLIMAALVAGTVWGALYAIRPRWLPALVLSHAIWMQPYLSGFQYKTK